VQVQAKKSPLAWLFACWRLDQKDLCFNNAAANNNGSLLCPPAVWIDVVVGWLDDAHQAIIGTKLD